MENLIQVSVNKNKEQVVSSRDLDQARFEEHRENEKISNVYYFE